jgi:hypothetical protein
MSKFDSPRDELLYAMTLDGWANESSGDVESPTGFFARISNADNEIAEIRDAFPEESAGISNASIVGHFLCLENSQGLWSVIEYESAYLLERTYQEIDRAYGEWLGDDE